MTYLLLVFWNPRSSAECLFLCQKTKSLEYKTPEMIEMGEQKVFKAYSADIVTDCALDGLQRRSADAPFFLMTTYKATHNPFFPNPKRRHLYTEPIPGPSTFNDSYENRATASAINTAQVGQIHLTSARADS